MIEVVGKKGKLNIVFALTLRDRDTLVFSYNEEIPIKDAYIITCDYIRVFCCQVLNNLNVQGKIYSTIILYTNENDIDSIDLLKECANRIENVDKLANQVVIMHK